VATPVLLKPEKLDSENKGYSELAKELGATKREFNPSSLNSAVKQDSVLKGLPVDKAVADLSVATQLQGNDSSANKNIVADLATLSRQVENMQANKQDVPAMTKQLNHPEWKQEFNDRIIWMQNKGISQAELRINPNNLGPISINIKMDADQQASISINVQNGAVRDAVESALPRLREMLNSQQIALADVNVSQQQQQQQQGQNNARQTMEEAQQENNEANAELASLDENDSEGNSLADEINLGRAVASNGLLSLYA
jgi:flagellar hook-length control protein FliK